MTDHPEGQGSPEAARTSTNDGPIEISPGILDHFGGVLGGPLLLYIKIVHETAHNSTLWRRGAWVTVQTLGQETSVAVKTLRAWLHALESAGYLRLVERGHRGMRVHLAQRVYYRIGVRHKVVGLPKNGLPKNGETQAEVSPLEGRRSPPTRVGGLPFKVETTPTKPATGADDLAPPSENPLRESPQEKKGTPTASRAARRKGGPGPLEPDLETAILEYFPDAKPSSLPGIRTLARRLWQNLEPQGYGRSRLLVAIPTAISEAFGARNEDGRPVQITYNYALRVAENALYHLAEDLLEQEADRRRGLGETVIHQPDSPAARLRRELAARGIPLDAEAGQLRISPTCAERLTDEDKAAIKEHYAALVALFVPTPRPQARTNGFASVGNSVSEVLASIAGKAPSLPVEAGSPVARHQTESHT